ncbi:optic atrophy 3-like protein [Apiospora arundinis]
MEDHHEFLARHIIAEDKLMTYRTLSRSMKVHVNLAKQMLYDFHKTHIAKFPGSLHVTYLVYGTRKTAEDEQDDDDVDMTDSVTDMDATFSQAVPTRTLTVVREEALQETLEQYAEVTSIHIYSVAPHPMRDLQFLADAAQQVVEMSIQEDFSVGANKTYGTLINPNTRRRERRAGAPPPAAPAKAQPKPQVKQETKPTINLKEEPKWALTKEAKDSKPAANTTAKKVAAAAAPALKRQGSSGGIGQMFAKQASKPKKPAAKPKEEAPAPALSDEGEDDSEAMPEAKQAAEEDGKSRRDRQAELRRMMDESDDEEEESKSEPESPADEPMDEDPAPPEPEPEAKEEEGPAEIVASSGDGRRRGRRRVMKKKQIMDEQGYLVTIQEQGWESFSEEEKPAPKPQKAKPAAAEKAAPAGKSKKAAPKGQGNIMSFFGKK